MYQPQIGRSGQATAVQPLQHIASQQQAPPASSLSSYAQLAAASAKALSNPTHASHPQQHPQQEPQPQHLMPLPPHADMQPHLPPVSTHPPAEYSSQQQQQQRPAASRQPAYATGISSLPPHMAPSSTLLSSHASQPPPASAPTHIDQVYAPMQLPSGTAFLPGSTPPGSMQQQQQQMMGQHHERQVGSWPLQSGLQQGGAPLPQQQAVGQGVPTWQATAADAERTQQRPASVPAGAVGGSCSSSGWQHKIRKATACQSCGCGELLCHASLCVHVGSGFM